MIPVRYELSFYIAFSLISGFRRFNVFTDKFNWATEENILPLQRGNNSRMRKFQDRELCNL
jgi:hypothetical protein